MPPRGASPLFDVPAFPTLRRVKPLPKRRRTADPAALPATPGDAASAAELLAHADTLSAHMALQAYYLPILDGVHDLLRSASARPDDAENDADNDADYTDHLPQHGNTKKRKVPAHAAGPPGTHDTAPDDDEPIDRGVPTGRAADTEAPEAPPPLPPRRGRLAPATLAGLQHKEMLRSRKRQLAAVLGALSHGDTLALDQALSAHYPLGGERGEAPRVRLSRRPRARATRAVRRALPLRHPDERGLPRSEFTFAWPSATSDRLVATKAEVAVLRGRFEAELARQAAKAAKLAASANKMMAALPAKGARARRAERAQQRARTGAPGVPGGEQTAEFLEQGPAGPKARGGKKKKRSALANASNPHHLRNYVPSRLPHTGAATTPASNELGPFPIRFLSAEIPPRRRKKAAAQPTTQLTNPADEWICAFCEYELFYGDEQDYRRAIRSRKKILRRRRRARERAAAAASGTSTVKGSGGAEEEYDDGGVEGAAGAAGAAAAVAAGKKGRDAPLAGTAPASFG